MKIFHIFAVTPIDVASHELPAVQLHDHFVCAQSLESAFAEIKEHSIVIKSSEVFGAESNRPIIIDSFSRLNQRVNLGQHRHWANVQKQYALLSKGGESPEQFVERRFAENHPHFA